MNSLKDATKIDISDKLNLRLDEETGSPDNKFPEVMKKDQFDVDKLLNDLIESNVSHSYHANFKDSIKSLTKANNMFDSKTSINGK